MCRYLLSLITDIACLSLFSVSSRSSDFAYEVEVTLLEIYNEKVLDLLTDKPAERRDLRVIQTAQGMEVQDITRVAVSTQQEVLDTLTRGSKNRTARRTDMNDQSSRSHLILSVYASAVSRITGKAHLGKLHLIDLAGSERVGRSNVTGDALKEAQNINLSLSALGNVIHARANKVGHVPYRDSALTYLLQDSLEKNSKTLMFVQVSPCASDVGETLCSLKFAARVRQVELGKATTNAAPAAATASSATARKR